MDIYIVTLGGESFPLNVQPDMTVASLKRLIEKHLCVPPSKQKLSYENGTKVSLADDSKLLSWYGLRSGSRVFVLVTNPAPIQVILKNEKGNMSTYDVEMGESVAEFKQKVYRKEKVPVDQQRLIHESKQMEDNCKLEDYGVQSGSTIFLTLRLRGG